VSRFGRFSSEAEYSESVMLRVALDEPIASGATRVTGVSFVSFLEVSFFALVEVDAFLGLSLV